MIELTTGIMFAVSSMYGSTTPIDTSYSKINTNYSIDNAKEITVTTDRKSIEKYLKEKFSDTPILVEIARCESTFTHYDKDGKVIRGKANSDDIGVMQINEKYHLDTAKKMNIDIYTIDGNINYAKYLYDKYGAEPWSASSACWSSKPIAMGNR